MFIRFEESPTYICDQDGCWGSMQVPDEMKWFLDGLKCCVCGKGKYMLFEPPKYVGWKVEGETDYRHEAEWHKR